MAAAEAGVGAEKMAADGGQGGEPMVEAMAGADGLRAELAGGTLLPGPRA